MDRLDDLLDAARPMLDRVDQMLSVVGAPGEHRVWVQLRRVRLLPGDAARAVASLKPAALGEAGPEIRAEARACVAIAAELPTPGEWSGEAAESASSSLPGGHPSCIFSIQHVLPASWRRYSVLDSSGYTRRKSSIAPAPSCRKRFARLQPSAGS